MSSLSEIYIKKETMQTMLDVITKKGEKGVSITISISDESNEWGHNVSAYVSQTKEQREAKKPRYYVGNGRVFWNDSKITNGVKPEEQEASDNGGEPDLPF